MPPQNVLHQLIGLGPIMLLHFIIFHFVPKQIFDSLFEKQKF